MTAAEIVSVGSRASAATRIFSTTPDRFRELVPATGLRLCRVDYDERRRREASCVTIAPAQVTAHFYDDEIAPVGADLLARVMMSCKPSPGACASDDSSGHGVSVRFVG